MHFSSGKCLIRVRISPTQVVVGQPLYEIDVDATAAAAASSSAPAAASAPAASAPAGKAAAPKEASSHEHGRVPLIKFVGKRDKTKKSHLKTATPAAAVTNAPAFKPLKEGNGVHFTTLKGAGLFGRPALSQREIDAIESGGAVF